MVFGVATISYTSASSVRIPNSRTPRPPLHSTRASLTDSIRAFLSLFPRGELLSSVGMGVRACQRCTSSDLLVRMPTTRQLVEA